MKKLHLLRRTKSKLLARLGRRTNAGPHLEVRPDDTFIVSYPRSGNTWMRFLVGGLATGRDVDFQNMEELVPDIYRCSHAHLEKMASPRLLKSHEPYDPRYPKVVYLVRDPRDVAVSYFEWLRKFGKWNDDFDAFIRSFLDGRTRYGGWAGHVEGWMDDTAVVSGGFLLVRYEDLLTDVNRELGRVAAFLELDVGASEIEAVAEANRFRRMRKKEEEASDGDLFSDTREDIRFVRSGRSGQWGSRLEPRHLRSFADRFGTIALSVGYDLRGPDRAVLAEKREADE